MPTHPLTNFEIQTYYQNEPKFNGVYSRNTFPTIKDVVYVINLDDHKSAEIYQIAFYVNGINRRASYDVICFDSSGVETIPKKIKHHRKQHMITTIYRIKEYDSKCMDNFILDLLLFGLDLFYILY